MRQASRFYLSLGSNIEPERNLVEAVRRLRQYGEVQALSSVWESHPIGAVGPNFLNVCLAFRAPVTAAELKHSILDAVEKALGRTRTEDRNAPRTMDIDIILDGDVPVHPDRWSHAFVVLPMAELLPDFPHPLSYRTLAHEAARARESSWIRRRADMLIGEAEEH